MENNNQQYTDYTVVGSEPKVASKTFIASVFLWMFAALALSAFFAYLFAANESLLVYLISETGKGLSILGWVVMLAPLGFVMLMSFGFHKLSSSVMISLLLIYSAINGISFSFILLAYTASSVIGCFLSAAAMFGIMAFMGYTTDKDLTGFGRLMTMGLIGMLVTMLINFFLRSSGLDYIISIIGVMIFTGLTAFHVQKLKRIGEGTEYEGVGADNTRKMAVLGALTLYLDFINIFLFLLRLFGGRRD
jgi:FtsH-binding integral membrane protein